MGLDNAGKTTILYKLHLGEVIVSHPTVGSNVEQVKYKNITLEVAQRSLLSTFVSMVTPVWSQIWDLGGQQTLRPFWPTYFKSTDAIIMVVDSTDRARVGVTKACTFWLLVVTTMLLLSAAAAAAAAAECFLCGGVE